MVSRRANRLEAWRWWNKRNYYLQKIYSTEDSQLYDTSCFNKVTANRIRWNLKALSGRGRKLRPWVAFVLQFIDEEWERLRDIEAKVTTYTLLEIVRSAVLLEEAPFPAQMICPQNNKPLIDLIDKHFIERYCYTSKFVQRINSGNKRRSVEFTDQLEKSIAFHLEQIACSFSNGEINEGEVENKDETHFVFDRSVNYMGVVSGAEGMTVVLRVTGGVNSRIASPFFIFKSRAESYPIAGSPDNNPRVSYRTQRNGWMDGKRFVQWLKESRAISSVPNNRHRQLFLDNCSGHRPSAEANAAQNDIRTNLRYFLANAMHVCQPLDSSLIYSFKQK